MAALKGIAHVMSHVIFFEISQPARMCLNSYRWNYIKSVNVAFCDLSAICCLSANDLLWRPLRLVS